MEAELMRHYRPRKAAIKPRPSPRKKAESAGLAGRFLRSAFYYLKAEQYLKTSMRLLCDAA
ncbi:MAG TPA: hypothetical protein DCZ93_08400 [Elusimicrobia bacterium]|nr:MAG: hypothetical protein A2X35_02620 [Elusimicrobia bacterium GWA2_61_42]HBB67305.1 hypothetical protein [Elusimicrobiota bacterium]